MIGQKNNIVICGCDTLNYNVMTETSKLKKYLMWYKVNELFSDGLKKSQNSKALGLHRHTVIEKTLYVFGSFLTPRFNENSDVDYQQHLETTNCYDFVRKVLQNEKDITHPRNDSGLPRKRIGNQPP